MHNSYSRRLKVSKCKDIREGGSRFEYSRRRLEYLIFSFHGNCESRVKDLAGQWRDSEHGLDEVMVQYFQTFYTSQHGSTDVCLSTVGPKVSITDNAFLIAPISTEEVKNAIFGMHPNKSPGPDGMNTAFYQCY